MILGGFYCGTTVCPGVYLWSFLVNNCLAVEICLRVLDALLCITTLTAKRFIACFDIALNGKMRRYTVYIINSTLLSTLLNKCKHLPLFLI